MHFLEPCQRGTVQRYMHLIVDTLFKAMSERYCSEVHALYSRCTFQAMSERCLSAVQRYMHFIVDGLFRAMWQRYYIPRTITSRRWLAATQTRTSFACLGCRRKRKLRRRWKPLPTLVKEKKATLVPSTVELLYQQTKKAPSDRSNRIPEGGKKSQRNWRLYAHRLRFVWFDQDCVYTHCSCFPALSSVCTLF